MHRLKAASSFYDYSYSYSSSTDTAITLILPENPKRNADENETLEYRMR